MTTFSPSTPPDADGPANQEIQQEYHREYPEAALGEVRRLASMICWATFKTSTMPIIMTRLVVFTIRVMRLMDSGISRRTVWGRITSVYT